MRAPYLNAKSIKKNFFSISIVAFYFCYFFIWWTYKLDFLPGLHADEAWFGLKALQFRKTGIDHLYGMTKYTGILQSYLSSIFFKWYGNGVQQLRLPGVIFNVIGLGLITSLLRTKKTMLFFLIMGQLVFFLISPRVAWEVNSLTLFFVALVMISVYLVQHNHQNYFRAGGAFLFLLANILGTYNHIIFSSLSGAILIGAILFSLETGDWAYKNIIILGLINMLNLVCLYFAMKYYTSVLIGSPIISVGVFFILSVAELYIWYGLINITPTIRKVKNGQLISRFIFVLLITSFLYFHGRGFFNVFANYKVLIHFFSYSPSFPIVTIFIISGSVLLLYLSKCLVNDIFFIKDSAFALLIVTYAGILSIYTTNCSFRYYWILIIIVAIYLSIKISTSPSKYIIWVLCFSTIFTNINLVYIFQNPDKRLKPQTFDMGNGKLETSAHFLISAAIIDSLKKKKVVRLVCPEDKYFIEEPVLFYYSIQPWVSLEENFAIISYDYKSLGSGFNIKIDSAQQESF